MTSSETFHDHVKELRNRLFVVFFSVALFSIFGYVFRNSFLNFIHQPLNSPLYYNTPAGAFNLSLKISIIIGIFISIPVILYQIIKFIQPALFNTIKPITISVILATSSVLAIVGAAFGFYILLPLSLHFFGGYSSKNITPLLSASEYFNYVLNIIIAFAILFQIPLIIDFINRIRPLKPKQLLKYQKHTIVGAIIIAIILPFTFDPLTQFIVAIPIVALYYLSIIMVSISNRQTREARLRSKYSKIEPIANKHQTYIPVFNNNDLILDRSKPIPNTNHSSINSSIAKKQPIKVQQNGIKSSKARFIDGFKPVVGSI